MLKWFNKKKKDNKGFTLVELVIVVAILAILVGLLAPQYVKYVEKSRRSADASNLEEMVKAFQVACADSEDGVIPGTYTFTLKNGADATLATDDGDETSVETAIQGILGDSWKKTRLKSAQWKDDKGTATAISAECKLNEDGSVSVKYVPEDLKNYISASQGGTTTKPSVE